MNESVVRCGNCREPLPPNHVGPCPNCRHTERLYDKLLVSKLVFGRAELSWEHRHEFIRKNPLVNLIALLLTFGSPFLGLVVAAAPGLLIGLVIGLIGYRIGPLAAERIIEITKGKGEG